MKQEISPKETSRAQAFELWMSSPMPMVTEVCQTSFDAVQYGALLVHRQGSQSDERILFAA